MSCQEPMCTPLRDPRAWVRHLLECFSHQDQGATGALLLDEKHIPLGILLLELGPAADRSALYEALNGAAAQIVPFLFRPAEEPTASDLEIEGFVEIKEATEAKVPDAIYFWTSGTYMARSTRGQIETVEIGGG